MCPDFRGERFAFGFTREAGVRGRAFRDRRGLEQDGWAGGEWREIIGAVDETFLERMLLVFMDLRTGYLQLKAVADDHTYTVWKALVDGRLTALEGVMHFRPDAARLAVWHAKPTPLMSVTMHGPL
jgi:hypothetical protein